MRYGCTGVEGAGLAEDLRSGWKLIMVPRRFCTAPWSSSGPSGRRAHSSATTGAGRGHLDRQPVRQGVHHRQADAVQAAGGLIDLVENLPPECRRGSPPAPICREFRMPDGDAAPLSRTVTAPSSASASSIQVAWPAPPRPWRCPAPRRPDGAWPDRRCHRYTCRASGAPARAPPALRYRGRNSPPGVGWAVEQIRHGRSVQIAMVTRQGYAVCLAKGYTRFGIHHGEDSKRRRRSGDGRSADRPAVRRDSPRSAPSPCRRTPIPMAISSAAGC